MKPYTVSLDEKVMTEAREQLETGQKLSPVLNQLLKDWVKKKKDEKERS